MPAKKAAKAPPPQRTTKTAPPREPMTPQAKARTRKLILNGLGAILFAGVIGAGFVGSKRYVEQITGTDAPPTVVLADRPVWMSDTLASQIIDSVQPTKASDPLNHATLQTEANTLAANPWVRSVKSVRRSYKNGPGDVVQVSCDFRAPVALVHWQDAYWYVDADGVRLPDALTVQQVRQLLPAGQTPEFRVIEGVAHVPASIGKPWPGGDVQAGIELIALLDGKPYADQIVKIDVTNYAGRVSPNDSQINLITRYGTEIRWGQPPSSKAFFVEQRVDRKLNVLAEAREQTGRVDMNQPWIDLRFDSPIAPDKRASLDR